MKKQQKKLDFRRESILELTDSKLQSVEGGTLSLIPFPKSVYYLTIYYPPIS